LIPIDYSHSILKSNLTKTNKMVSFKSLFILAAASLLSTATASPSSHHNGSKHWAAADDAASGLSVDVGSGTEIIIIAANGGGTSSTKYYNTQSMAAGTTHMVTVGGTAGLVYTPSSINASVGDIVQFNFESKNHTVTQSSFAAPCVKSVAGFDSGFMPNINNTVSPAPMLQFQVTTSTPIWMFCAQTGHCGEGMVFSINPTAAKSQAAFEAAAKAQNGTTTAAGAGAAAASASSSATTGSTATSSVAAVAAATSGSVATGTGTLTSGGACSCSCLCGAADFPAGAGLGAVGGVGGEFNPFSISII
jgi:plastocyanin